MHRRGGGGGSHAQAGGAGAGLTGALLVSPVGFVDISFALHISFINLIIATTLKLKGCMEKNTLSDFW